jgi:hypothetical protein
VLVRERACERVNKRKRTALARMRARKKDEKKDGVSESARESELVRKRKRTALARVHARAS